jgi:hypothetical protein
MVRWRMFGLDGWDSRIWLKGKMWLIDESTGIDRSAICGLPGEIKIITQAEYERLKRKEA